MFQPRPSLLQFVEALISRSISSPGANVQCVYMHVSLRAAQHNLPKTDFFKEKRSALSRIQTHNTVLSKLLFVIICT